MAFLSFPAKDPDEVLDYTVDWTDRLVGDTISSSDWEVTGSVTIDSDTNSTSSATVWLSGGTVNTLCLVTNRIVTAGGRTHDQTVRLKIRTK